MRIAVISDIHGNLPALETVLSDIENRQIDQIICLGDLVDFAPWHNEVIELIRANKITTIMGNHDERIGYDLPIRDKSEQSEEEKTARRSAIEITKKTITFPNKCFLKTLPRYFVLGFSDKKIHFTHASPQSINEYLYENNIALQNECLEISSADVLVVGHTHLPYIREHKQGIILNVGSVGRTKEVDKKAVYAIIEVKTDNSFLFEIIRVNYPFTKTAQAIYDSEINNFYADQLIKS